MSEPIKHFHVKANAYLCYDLETHRTRFGIVPCRDCVEHDGGEFKSSEARLDVKGFRIAGGVDDGPDTRELQSQEAKENGL